MLMYAPGSTAGYNEGIPGVAWLQREAYLLNGSIPEIGFEFDGGRFGAYCGELGGMLERGIRAGNIIRPGGKSGQFWLSESGMGIGRELWKHASKLMKEEILDLKGLMNDMTYEEMIAFSHSMFPETTTNSKIIDQFERTRIDAACSLFRKDKISLERAACVAGVPRAEFIDVLEGRGIPAYVADPDGVRAAMRIIGGS